jgi:iron complex outermembrane receptor protein
MKNNLYVTTAVSALAIAIAVGLVASDVRAQTADGSGDLEEIVVTARKREERVQQVPDSVSVFTASTIEDAHIQSLSDVSKLVPNLSVSTGEQPGLLLFNIRGIGQVRNGEPPIAVVVDGVQLFDINQISQGLFDIEQIEVLKGPQGAVYGRDAIGGAINIVTKQPTNDFAGWIQAGGGSGGDRELQAAISGPIVTDKLLFRFNGALKDFDGDIKDVYNGQEVNDENTQAGRLQLIATPTDNLKIDLRANVDNIHSGAAWYTFIPPGDTSNAILPIVENRIGRSSRLVDDFSVKVDYDATFATLTSITALAFTHVNLTEDFDYFPQDYLEGVQGQSDRQLSEEFRVTSPTDQALHWQVGSYVLNTDSKIDSVLYAEPGASYLLVPFQITSPLIASATRASDHNVAYAFFGQASYRPLPEFELTAGLRFDTDDRAEIDRGEVGNPEFTHNFYALQPKGQASYFFTDDAMGYISIGKGFRSGGFNPSDRVTRVYQAETDVNYEIGVKTSWFDKRLTANAAGFYTQVQNRQVYLFDETTATQIIASPIPHSEIEGVEAELDARPVSGLTVQLTGGLQDSRITSYNPAVFAGTGITGNFTGKSLPEIPGYTYSMAVQYAMPTYDEVILTPRIEFNGSGGRYYWNIDNTAERSSINLINLRLTAEYHFLSLTGFVENLSGKKYILDYDQQNFSGSPFGNYNEQSPGRRYGIQLRAEY